MFFENPDQYQFFRNSLEHYTLLANFSRDCLWEKDLSGNKINWIDGGHKRVFGYQIENQLICEHWWEAMIHPDERNMVLARLSVAISEPDTTMWEQEYRFRNSAGVFIPVHNRACIIRNAEKKAVKLIGVTQDISNRLLKHQQRLDWLLMNQRKTEQEILAFRDGENERIGRELFDNIGQVMIASRMYLEMVVTSKTQRCENATRALQYVKEAITGIRLLANGLLQPHLSSVGIFETLRGFIGEVSLLQKMHIKFSVLSVLPAELNEQLQETLYRIIQEQLINIIDRSATRASISISKKNKHLILIISDDGRKKHTSREKKAVLTTIKSRVELAHGCLSSVSHRKGEYVITVMFPLTRVRQTATRTTKIKKEPEPALLKSVS